MLITDNPGLHFYRSTDRNIRRVRLAGKRILLDAMMHDVIWREEPLNQWTSHHKVNFLVGGLQGGRRRVDDRCSARQCHTTNWLCGIL